MRAQIYVPRVVAALVLTLLPLACRDAPSAPTSTTVHVRTAPISGPSSDIILLHDTRLDDADAAVEKAIALLNASQDPGVKRPFGGHVDKAIRLLEKAREEIAAGAAWADQHQ